MQFILGWAVIIIETVIAVIVSRLITTDQETIMVLFFGYAVFYQILEISNHASTFYQPIKNNLVLNFISKIFVTGPYHVLHHSSYEEHAMANLGGNIGIWDFVFGTYCELPEQVPPFGLTNQPALELSAMAIVFGGLQQLFYELKHNKDFKTRFNIIFGGIYYKPPITKDFLMIADGGYHVELHRITA
ncbi:MAG: sterol desaturase family protein [Bacteroidetes bacterium]|nr:sterol desaturase family protein [Bacteroidota bacterium]